jgi:hypothetical protein
MLSILGGFGGSLPLDSVRPYDCANNSGGRLVQHLLSPPVCRDLGGDTTPSPPTGTGVGYNGYFPTRPGAEEAELS